MPPAGQGYASQFVRRRLNEERRGLCTKCDKPKAGNSYCKEHGAIYARERLDRKRAEAGVTLKRPDYRREVGYVPHERSRKALKRAVRLVASWAGLVTDGGPIAHRFAGDKTLCGRALPMMIVPLTAPGNWPQCKRCAGIS